MLGKFNAKEYFLGKLLNPELNKNYILNQNSEQYEKIRKDK